MADESAYRVLGVDPGLNITGYGCLAFDGREPRIIEAGAIRTDAKTEMAHRLTQIYEELTALIAELKPDLLAVEKLYSHYGHPLTSVQMGHARGVILLAAQQAGLRVAHLPATKVKKSLTGNGHASKVQVQRSIQSVFGLDAPPEPNDVADALAIALCGGQSV